METIFLEDLAKEPKFGERISAALAAAFLPSGALERFAGSEKTATLDDLATIIFSSGSTGEPKGVMLTHYNVAANVDQLSQIFFLGSHDRIMGILPFFHSFGFTGCLCLPAATGIGVVFHPNPLDSRVIGALVNKHAVTILLATPTFLNAYARRCTPEEFGSLRFVMAGAEKLPERISVAFEDHFGIRPLEGYGCTECSPVVAVNTIDFRAASFRQVGAKRGTIGHPLPGITVKIVDPDSGRAVGVDEPGLLLVRGPNVMKGYLGRPEKTAEVLRDGWYNTGDIATVDEDGFLRITDRLSRFSKIGGEMVPHIKVEEKLQELAGMAEQAFVVTAVPDEKKGERLIVLHTLIEAKLDECLELFAKCDLPALWRPRGDQFVRCGSVAVSGDGEIGFAEGAGTGAGDGEPCLRAAAMNSAVDSGTRSGLWLRIALTAGALAIWFWTQSLIGARSLPASGIGDGLHSLTAGWNAYLQQAPAAANALLIVSSALIDAIGLFLLGMWIFGGTVRPFLGLLLLLGLRQVMQALCALPAPPNLIWHYPGFPSLFVTYGVANDYFFSGHTGIAVLGAIELARLRRGWLTASWAS